MRKERIKGRKGWGSKEGKKGGREGKKNLIRESSFAESTHALLISGEKKRLWG